MKTPIRKIVGVLVLPLVVAAGRPAQAEDAKPLLHIGWQQAYIEMMADGNCTAALRILDTAQKAGFHAAYGAEASMAENGNCVEKDMEHAVKLHTIAAPFYPHSEVRLWAIYEYGLAGEPDLAQAKYWAERAARHYIDKTRDEAGAAFAENAGLQTPTATVHQALDQVFAIKSKGLLHMTVRALELRPGESDDSDSQASCEWLKYTAKEGLAEATISYAQTNLYGVGIIENASEAIWALEKGMALKQLDSFRIVVLELISGRRLKKNYQEAYRAALFATNLGDNPMPYNDFFNKYIRPEIRQVIKSEVQNKPQRLPMMFVADLDADAVLACWAKVAPH